MPLWTKKNKKKPAKCEPYSPIFGLWDLTHLIPCDVVRRHIHFTPTCSLMLSVLGRPNPSINPSLDWAASGLVCSHGLHSITHLIPYSRAFVPTNCTSSWLSQTTSFSPIVRWTYSLVLTYAPLDLRNLVAWTFFTVACISNISLFNPSWLKL